MDADEYRLCLQVAEDLTHLREAWNDRISESLVRRESPVLRRLLSEGDYPKAWRALGLPRQPALEGHDLDTMLGSFPVEFIRYAFPTPSQWTRPVGHGGGQQVKMLNPGAQDGDLMLARPGYSEGQGALFAVIPKEKLVNKSEKEFAQLLHQNLTFTFARPFWLNEYLDSSGAYVNGEKVTRRQIIDFIANTMGGAHYDPKNSRISKKAFRSLLKPLHVKWSGAQDVHAPWIELMSIGQSIARSTDAMRYCKEFERISPPSDLPLSDDG